jgi:sugar-specific transcriptional regulator TrmB
MGFVHINIDGNSVICIINDMNNRTNLQKIFGLSQKEIKVFEFLLLKNRIRISVLVKECKLPRSTIKDILQRLRSQGLVRSVKVGKCTEWKATNRTVLTERLLNTVDFLQKPKTTKHATKKTRLRLSRQTEFIVYVGWSNMIRIYKKEIIAHKKQRLFAIQGATSAQVALDKATSSKFIELNLLIRENKTITEAIISENMLELYKSQNKNWLESMRNRISAIRVVPDEALDFNAELVIFKDKFFLANWEEEILVVIKNKDILSMILKLYKLLHSIGKPIDQNKYLNKLIEKEYPSI